MQFAVIQQPDFRILKECRGVQLQGLIDELFEAIIHEQIEEKYISIENQFLDTTKK